MSDVVFGNGRVKSKVFVRGGRYSYILYLASPYRRRCIVDAGPAPIGCVYKSDRLQEHKHLRKGSSLVKR